MHQAAQVIPLVHATHLDTITEANWHALGKVYVVGNQECLAIADINNEALVPRAVFIITQKAADEAFDFDPPPVIAFSEINASPPLQAPS